MAYLILRIKEGPQRTGTIVEYAGERSAIADALPHLVARHALARLVLHVPAWDPLLSRLAAAGALAGASSRWSGVDHHFELFRRALQLLLMKLKPVAYRLSGLGSRE